jgi:hypothetical protein
MERARSCGAAERLGTRATMPWTVDSTVDIARPLVQKYQNMLSSFECLVTKTDSVKVSLREIK